MSLSIFGAGIAALTTASSTIGALSLLVVPVPDNMPPLADIVNHDDAVTACDETQSDVEACHDWVREYYPLPEHPIPAPVEREVTLPAPITAPEATPTPEVTPEPTPAPEPSLAPVTEAPTTEPTPTPEPVTEPAPEPSPVPEPTPEPSPSVEDDWTAPDWCGFPDGPMEHESGLDWEEVTTDWTDEQVAQCF